MLEQAKKLSPQEEYSLNKQLFSGFPKYMATGSTLQQLMHNNMLSGIEEDYNDFIRSCPDTTLTNPVKEHTINYCLLKLERIFGKPD